MSYPATVSPNLPFRYFRTLSGRMGLSPLSARNPSSVCFAGAARGKVNGGGFFFTHLPPLFLNLFGGRLEEPQRNPLGVSVQPCHRPPEGQRLI
jgi:hypothetical protein